MHIYIYIYVYVYIYICMYICGERNSKNFWWTKVWCRLWAILAQEPQLTHHDDAFLLLRGQLCFQLDRGLWQWLQLRKWGSSTQCRGTFGALSCRRQAIQERIWSSWRPFRPRWEGHHCHGTTSHRSSSFPCGVGLQLGAEDHLHERRRGLGQMAGSVFFLGPASRTWARRFFRPDGKDGGAWGTEIENDSGDRPVGRWRICGAIGRGPGEVVPTIPPNDRWLAARGGGPNIRTGERLGQAHQHAGHLTVDFGVCVPYGSKALRASRFRSYVFTASGYVTKELPGPAAFVQWRASFRILHTALVMLDAASLASLHAYEMTIERLTRTYPSAWHLIYSADELARSSHSTRLRSRMVMDARAGRDVPLAWDPKRPWDFVCNLVAMEDSFWQQHAISPALAWIASGSQGRPKTPAEQLAAGFMIGGVNAITPQAEGANQNIDPTLSGTRGTRRSNTGKRQRDGGGDGDEPHGNNKGSGRNENKKGKGKGPSKQLCYGWNNGNGPCAGLPAWRVEGDAGAQVHNVPVAGSPIQGLPQEEGVTRHAGEGENPKQEKKDNETKGGSNEQDSYSYIWVRGIRRRKGGRQRWTEREGPADVQDIGGVLRQEGFHPSSRWKQGPFAESAQAGGYSAGHWDQDHQCREVERHRGPSSYGTLHDPFDWGGHEGAMWMDTTPGFHVAPFQGLDIEWRPTCQDRSGRNLSLTEGGTTRTGNKLNVTKAQSWLVGA